MMRPALGGGAAKHYIVVRSLTLVFAIPTGVELAPDSAQARV